MSDLEMTKLTDVDDLNRAIVECVAKMRAEEKLCPDGCDYRWIHANHYVCARCGKDIEGEI